MKRKTSDNNVFHFFSMSKSLCTGENILEQNLFLMDSKVFDKLHIIIRHFECIFLDTLNLAAHWIHLSLTLMRNLKFSSPLLLWKSCLASHSSQDDSKTCLPMSTAPLIYGTKERYQINISQTVPF